LLFFCLKFRVVLHCRLFAVLLEELEWRLHVHSVIINRLIKYVVQAHSSNISYSPVKLLASMFSAATSRCFPRTIPQAPNEDIKAILILNIGCCVYQIRVLCTFTLEKELKTVRDRTPTLIRNRE
jgi:hypothetical protein